MEYRKNALLSCHSKAFHTDPPFCPRVFYVSRGDKHSDLTCIAGDTVMAVAADSHRDFLIPERHRPAVRPTLTLPRQCSVFILLCLYYNANARKCQ